MMTFDPKEELNTLKQQTNIIRKRCYTARKSRLDTYTFEILSLRRTGAKIAEIQRFLRKHNINVHHSTVSRWLAKHE